MMRSDDWRSSQSAHGGNSDEALKSSSVSRFFCPFSCLQGAETGGKIGRLFLLPLSPCIRVRTVKRKSVTTAPVDARIMMSASAAAPRQKTRTAVAMEKRQSMRMNESNQQNKKDLLMQEVFLIARETLNALRTRA